MLLNIVLHLWMILIKIILSLKRKLIDDNYNLNSLLCWLNYRILLNTLLIIFELA